MSSSRSGSKPKRGQSGDEAEAESMASSNTPLPPSCQATHTNFEEWLDEGTQRADGTVDHQAFSIALQASPSSGSIETLSIRLGDVVCLRLQERPDAVATTATHGYYQEDNDNFLYYGSSTSPSTGRTFARARIERIWEDPGHKPSHVVRARWLLQRRDLESIPGDFGSTSMLSYQDFYHSLSDRDLVLTNQADDNPIFSICGREQVLYRRPESDSPSQLIGKQDPDIIYLCRYSLDFVTDRGRTRGNMLLTPFRGENDKLHTTEAPSTPSRPTKPSRRLFGSPSISTTRNKRRRDEFASSTSWTGSSDGEESIMEVADQGGVDEGTIEKRDIRVGVEHQVDVPVFDPSQNIITSRKPTLVWKPGKANQEHIDRYWELVADILTPHLLKSRRTHEEPYSPLTRRRMEELVYEMGTGRIPTLSTVCTALSIPSRRMDVLRELDVDSLLTLLHSKNYNVEAAVAAIKASPEDFYSVWSMEEKQIFDSHFRKYSGSLRMICKGLPESKTFHHIVDYNYRFKIPDQFRCFQETKNEQAVEMIESMEANRHADTFINASHSENPASNNSNINAGTGDNWFKKTLSNSKGALHSRRVEAKQYLIDLEGKHGPEEFSKFAALVKQLNRQTTPQLLSQLRATVKDDPDLKMRLLKFLPG